MANYIFAKTVNWETINAGSFYPIFDGIGLYYKSVPNGNAFCNSCKKDGNSYGYIIKSINETAPSAPDNNQSLCSYNITQGLIKDITYSDTLCFKCKGSQCLKYVFTFQPTGISSIYKAYAHIEITGTARDVLSGVTLHYARRMNGKGDFSDEETASFRWKSEDNAPEMIPQYIGDIYMDKSAATGQYYYNKNNIRIISKDIDCLSDKVNSTAANVGTFTDPRDGHVYKWVCIGKQIWMAENLSFITGDSHCYGDNMSKGNCAQYGRLYKWEDAMKACPAGWHLPSEEEIDNLIDNLGGTGKLAYKQLVLYGNSGFDALPGGYGTRVNGSNAFRFLPPGASDYYCAFWSSSEGSDGACTLYDLNNSTYSSRYSLGFDKNFSVGKYSFCSISDWLYVRCIKDKEKTADNLAKTSDSQPKNTINETPKNTQVSIDKGNNDKGNNDKGNTVNNIDKGNTVSNADKNQQPNTKTTANHKFFIVAGSYPSEQTAEDAVSSLKAKGFPNAKVLGSTAAGSWRVSCSDFATKEEASAELAKIKPVISSGWVFKGSNVNNADKESTINNSDKGSTVDNSDKGNTPNNADKGITVNNADKVSTANNVDKGSTVNNVDKGIVVNNIDKESTPNNVDNGNTANNADKGNTTNNVDKGSAINNSDKGSTSNNIDKGITVNNVDKGSTVNNVDKGIVVNNIDKGSTVNSADKGITANNVDKGSTVNSADKGNTPNNVAKRDTANNVDKGNTPNNADKGSTVNSADKGNVINNADKGSTSNNIDKGSTVNNNADTSKPINTTITAIHNFFIVVGSYPSEQTAEDAVSSLKAKGFPNAKVLGSTAAGSWRVSCSDFATKEEAIAELAKIKPVISSGWVFKGSNVNNIDKGSTVNNVDKGSTVNSADKGNTTNNVAKRDTTNNVDKGNAVINVDKGSTVNNVDKGIVVNNIDKESTPNNADKGSSSINIDKGSTANNVDKVSTTNNVDKGSTVDNSDKGIAPNNADTSKQTKTTAIAVHNFFIVVGSYPSEQTAEDAVSSLKTKGFANAKVVGLSAAGSWRIACSDFATKEEAITELARIKPVISAGWVFEKK